jgi:hypothetical protein
VLAFTPVTKQALFATESFLFSVLLRKRQYRVSKKPAADVDTRRVAQNAVKGAGQPAMVSTPGEAR